MFIISYCLKTRCNDFNKFKRWHMNDDTYLNYTLTTCHVFRQLDIKCSWTHQICCQQLFCCSILIRDSNFSQPSGYIHQHTFVLGLERCRCWNTVWRRSIHQGWWWCLQWQCYLILLLKYKIVVFQSSENIEIIGV